MLAHSVFLSLSLSLSGSGSLFLCFTFDQSFPLELSEAVWGLGRQRWESRAQPTWPESKSSLGQMPRGGPGLLSVRQGGGREGGQLELRLARGWGLEECAA